MRVSPPRVASPHVPRLDRLHDRPHGCTWLKALVPAVVALVLLLAPAAPAAACGGLIAPNGAVRLQRATTLVAWHDGVEHYLTTFTYEGDVSSVGYVVPLPSAPIEPVVAGGAWTLQRLERETHPVPPNESFGAAAPRAADAGVQVLQQVQIDALDVTVVKGEGDAVLTWATSNGFSIEGDTRTHLLAYSRVTPYFMAAKYDTAAAKARHQNSGDGTPVLITMRTAHPWVPFEVLALDDQQVQADLFLLSDTPLYTSDVGAVIGQSSVGSEVADAPGFRLSFQERMNDSLFHDLSTDRNMGWVPRESWLTYLELNAPNEEVTYDMGVSSAGVIRVAPFATDPMTIADRAVTRPAPGWLPHLPLGAPELALALLVLLGIGVVIVLVLRAALRAEPTWGRGPLPPEAMR
jgi:hypothetical protein